MDGLLGRADLLELSAVESGDDLFANDDERPANQGGVFDHQLDKLMVRELGGIELEFPELL